MKEFTLYGERHYFEIIDMFSDGSQLALYLKRSSDDEKIAYPTIWGKDLEDYETAKGALSAALESINQSAADFYSKPVEEKQGQALLKHLLENEVFTQDNKLKI